MRPHTLGHSGGVRTTYRTSAVTDFHLRNILSVCINQPSLILQYLSCQIITQNLKMNRLGLCFFARSLRACLTGTWRSRRLHLDDSPSASEQRNTESASPTLPEIPAPDLDLEFDLVSIIGSVDKNAEPE